MLSEKSSPRIHEDNQTPELIIDDTDNARVMELEAEVEKLRS